MITSMDNEKIKHYLRLRQKKHRQVERLFCVEGPHLVEVALQKGVVQRIYQTKEFDVVFEDTVIINDLIAKKLSDVQAPQGIYAICHQPQETFPTKRVLLLDRIQDPGNLGTILRNAVAFGFDTVVADQCVDFYDSKVLRSSQGAIFEVNCMPFDLLTWIKEHPEFTILSTTLENAIPLTNAPEMDEFFAIVLGNEGSGIRAEILAKSDYLITIEMTGMESLNVAVACGICCYHYRLRRKR